MAFNIINDCFQSLHRWLDSNSLCLNPDKSEAIVIGTSARQRSELNIKDVTVAGVTVPVTRTVKSRSVTTDNTLSFDDDINNVCQAAHFHIRAEHLAFILTEWLTCKLHACEYDIIITSSFTKILSVNIDCFINDVCL